MGSGTSASPRMIHHSVARSVAHFLPTICQDSAGVGWKRVDESGAISSVAEDSCLFNAVATRSYYGTGGGTTQGYDTTLQLQHVSRPSGEFQSLGGTVGRRDYGYDLRGNRTVETADCWTLTSTFSSPNHGDQLSSRAITSGCPLAPSSALKTQYGYDSDGRAIRKWWPSPTSPSSAILSLDFNAGIDAGHAALGAVYKSVSVNGSTFEYFYDAEGRRRLKSELGNHHAKHGSEWLGGISEAEYLARARQLLGSSPESGVQGFSRANGDIVRYNSAANEFGVVTAGGRIRTFFRPSSGAAYFRGQR